MIDIGVNLHSKLLSDKKLQQANPQATKLDVLDALVAEARAEGMKAMIAIGTCVKTSQDACHYARLHPGFIFATVGIHPHDAKNLDKAGIETLTELMTHPGVVAAGEMGLDFNRNFSPPEVQEKVFELQLELNRHHRRPLYLHERDAMDRQMEILQTHRSAFDEGVAHCFTGDKTRLRRYLDMGLHIGITGWVCDERRGAELAEAVSYIPPDRLLVETDSPYLLPRTLRPKPKDGRNKPWFVKEVIKQLAVLRNESFEDLERITTSNAIRLFSLAI